MSALPIADDVLNPEIPVLSLAQVSDALAVSSNKVRQLIRDRQLLAIRRDRELYIPAAFLVADGIVRGLSSTITVLADAGFNSTEMLRWLFTSDETLPGRTPANALRTSHGTEVKRRAQAMAF